MFRRLSRLTRKKLSNVLLNIHYWGDLEMSDERKKWNANNLDAAMKEAKEEFIELQMQLHHLLVKICKGIENISTRQE